MRSSQLQASSCTLLVVVEAAGSVAGVTSEVVRLCSAVEEVAGEVLLDAHRLGAGHRHCSAGSYARTRIASRNQYNTVVFNTTEYNSCISGVSQLYKTCLQPSAAHTMHMSELRVWHDVPKPTEIAIWVDAGPLSRTIPY